MDIEVAEMRLLESTDLNGPMSWAWVSKSPKNVEISNRLYGDLSNTKSLSEFLEIEDEIVSMNVQPRSEFTPFGESFVKGPSDSRKTVRGETESWISITSPLKHMLSTRSGVH
ncbi:MAG: hypothetical protein VX828_07180, partial [Candidatus Thermoplasmatota archaeon]|nr:hypothetical protein [Candidatus Thermoplasmatota archaeon]